MWFGKTGLKKKKKKTDLKLGNKGKGACVICIWPHFQATPRYKWPHPDSPLVCILKLILLSEGWGTL